MPRDIENLKHLIDELGYGAFTEQILQHAFASIRLETQPVDDEADLALGQSKIGGRPDLPPTLTWPRVPNGKKDTSLPFVAQLDLADLTPYDDEAVLPRSGVLYFFGDPWRGDFVDHGKVLFYTGDTAALQRTPYPADLPPTPSGEYGLDRYAPCALTIIPEVNLDWDVVESDDFADPAGKTWRNRSELVARASYRKPYPSVVNRVLGRPDDVPQDMQLDCQLIAEVGKPYNVTSEQRAQATTRKHEWRLLLQISSDSNANMMWSDMGTICYYIREADLAAHNFDKVCLAFFSS